MNPNYSFVLSAQVVPTSTISAGQLMVLASGTYLPATSSNRALYGRSEACALTSYGGASATGFIQVQQAGTLDASLTGLGTGAASWVRCSAAGIAERFTPVNAGSSDVIGWCETDGRVHLLFGVLTETMLVGGSSGLPAFPTVVGAYNLNVAAGPVYSWVSAFDPMTLAWTGYWTDYAGAPWTGTATYGNSGGRNLVAGVAPASISSTFGTHAAADFNGTTQYLDGALTVDQYLPPAAYYYDCVFNLDTVAAPGGAAYLDASLLGDNVNQAIYLGVSTSGIRAGHYSGGAQATPFIACGTGVKHFAQVWYDGVNVSLRLDGGAPVTVAAGVSTFFGGTNKLRIGGESTLAHFVDGKVGIVRTFGSVPGAPLRDQLWHAAQTSYGTV